MHRALCLAVGLVLLLGAVIVVPASSLGYVTAITIYNGEPYPIYNATIHLVFTPSNFTFPVDTSTIYFLDSRGNPLYYAVNIPQLDARIEWGIVPGYKYGGEPVNYTIYQPSAGWYSTSFSNFTNWTTGKPPFTNINSSFGQLFILLQGSSLYTQINYTNIWLRVYARPPNTTIDGINYHLYNAVLSIGYQDSNFTLYINGNEVATENNLTYKNNFTWVLGSIFYNTTYMNQYGVINITKYVDGSPILIALHENFTWLLEHTPINTTYTDIGLAYIMVPDYSNYLSVWVRVPVLEPGYNTIYMYYGSYNPYPAYNNPCNTFILYDNFNTNNTRWLWVNNYVISNGELIHTYTDRTNILWYPVNITLDNSLTLVVSTLGYYEGAGSILRDFTILCTNKTFTQFDPALPTYAMLSDIMTGNFYGYSFYNLTKWWISGNVPPTIFPFIYTHIERYNGVGINVTNTLTYLTFYNNTADPSHWLKNIYYIGIDPKGFAHIDVIYAYITDPAISITNTSNYELVPVTQTITHTVTVTQAPSFGTIIGANALSYLAVAIAVIFVTLTISIIVTMIDRLRGLKSE